ncbi:MAG: uroporphyrinogen-III C-methyltransferase [Pseudomonadales bacterium]|nr:uroporphyrinogen-III C-methyltransferase [Pseudomonadales bacterium]
MADQDKASPKGDQAKSSGENKGSPLLESSGSADTASKADSKNPATSRESTSGTAKNVPPEKIHPPKKPGEHKGHGGLWFCLLVAFGLAAASSAASFYLWQTVQRSGADNAHTSQAVQSLKQEIGNLQSEVMKVEKVAQTSEGKLAQFDKKLSSNTVRIEALSSMDRNSWVLAEVEFLLRLAIQRAVLVHDHKGAEKLLETADERVRGLDDPSLLPLRNSIARDRAALKLASTVDRDGLYLKLAALNTQLEQMQVVDLSTLQIKSPARFAAETAEPVTTLEKVEHGFWATLDKLSAIIKIQYHEEPVGPLLPPDQQSYLRMNLRFMMEQAQLALLQQRQEVYVDSLSKARVWVAGYFVIEDDVKAALLDEIDALIKVDVAKPLPDISGSLNQLHALLKVREAAGGK